jgi:hypothetical protein
MQPVYNYLKKERSNDHEQIVRRWFYILQYVAKSIATCKKNPYVINQNHIFSKKYCEVISG